MEINNISTYQPMKPIKPAEPTPPAGGNIENRQPPSEPSAPSKTTGASSESENTVNYSAQRSLQVILSDYSDVSNLGKEKQTDLTSRLHDSGLLEPGTLIDTIA